MVRERWRDVPGFAGRHQVSTLGRVRSTAFRGHAGRSALMKATPNYAGYFVVTLGVDRKQHRVHCLVLSAFKGARPKGTDGCHNDGDKANNAVTNLRWDTPAANGEDKRRHGVHVGVRNGRAKMNPDKVRRLRAEAAAGATASALGPQYGITPQMATLIINRANWSHVQ